MLFHLHIQSFQYHLLRRFFPHWITLPPFLKSSWFFVFVRVWGVTYRPFILFRWPIYLLYTTCIRLHLVSLWHSINSSTLFSCLKIVLPIPRPVHFHLHFRMNLSISKKKKIKAAFNIVLEFHWLCKSVWRKLTS